MRKLKERICKMNTKTEVTIQSTPEEKRTSLYFYDLPHDITAKDLNEQLKGLGFKAQSVRICKPRPDQPSDSEKTYAYVNFPNSDQAKLTMESLNKERVWSIKWAWRNPVPGKLFFKDFDKTTPFEDILDAFAEFGNMCSFDIELENDSPHGHVTYDDAESAEQAINAAGDEGTLALREGKKLSVEPYLSEVIRRSSRKTKKTMPTYAEIVACQRYEKIVAYALKRGAKKHGYSHGFSITVQATSEKKHFETPQDNSSFQVQVTLDRKDIDPSGASPTGSQRRKSKKKPLKKDQATADTAPRSTADDDA